VRRWGGPGCHNRGNWGGRRCGGGQWRNQWRHNNSDASNTPNATNEPSGENTAPVVETCRRWQRPNTTVWLSSRFIADVTINDGAQLEPKTPFNKVWRLQNTGNADWPAGTALSFVSGDALAGPDSVIIKDAVQPGQVIDVAIDLVAPAAYGRYISNYRLVTPGGISFGHRVWADILVVPPREEEVSESQPTPVEEKKEEPAVVIPVAPAVVPVPVVETKKEEPVPVAPPAPRQETVYLYAEQLATLEAMGFVNTQQNKIVLERHRGRVLEAIHDLLR